MGREVQTCDKDKITVKNVVPPWVGLDLRRRESCRERRRGWRRGLHDPVRPIILGDLLGYVRVGIERTARASSIPSTPTRATTGRRVIGIHVRIVATRTGCSGVIVLGSLAFLFSNTMDARARVYGVIDDPIRAFAPVGQWSGHFFETWVQREVMADGVLENK